MSIQSPVPLTIQADGEILGALPLTIEMQLWALAVLAPGGGENGILRNELFSPGKVEAVAVAIDILLCYNVIGRMLTFTPMFGRRSF